MTLNIVMVEPEIPQNTGNIARTCALTKTKLHLVRPLGFSVDDKQVRRAGLDYWELVDISYYDSIEEVFESYPEGRFFYATTKAEKTYTEFSYKENDFFVFGKETRGLDEDLIASNMDTAIKIPMITNIARSLNLANSVNIILFEALRQLDFPFYK